MAKNKNKKKKKNKKPTSKQAVSMLLIQNRSPGSFLSEADMERIYQNFRSRTKIKSGHAYVDEEVEPRLLRLYLIGSMFNTTTEFLVEYGSFVPVMGKTKGSEKTEIGFEITLKSVMTPGKTHRLRVLRKKHKATLFITL